MSVRINQRWPEGLKERVEARVGSKGVTRFTVEALEAALGPVVVDDSDYFAEKPEVRAVQEASEGQQKAGNAREGEEADVLNREPPASPRPSQQLPPDVAPLKSLYRGSEPQTYKCPAGHPFPKPPTSPSARCPACSRVVVPA